MRPPRPCGQPGGAGQRRRLDPAAPDDAARPDRRAVGERDVARPDLGDRDAEVQPHALAAEHLGHVVVRVLGERRRAACGRGRRCGSAPPRPRGRGTRRAIVSWIRSASAPASSTPVGPPPTMTKFSAPWSISDGSRSASSKTPMMRERSRVASSSEYSGNACSAAPGVWKKFGCEPAASTSASPVKRSPSAVVTVCVAGSIDATSASLTSTFGVVAEQLAQRERDVARRELRGRHLVQQRLELVVVVAVDQRDAHVVLPAPAAARSRRRRTRRRRRRRGSARSPSGDMRRAPVATRARPGARADGRRRAARWPSP